MVLTMEGSVEAAPVVVDIARGQPRYISAREHELATALHRVNDDLRKAQEEIHRLKQRVTVLQQANEELKQQRREPSVIAPQPVTLGFVQRFQPTELELLLGRVRQGLPLLAAPTAIKEWDKLSSDIKPRFEECLKRLAVKDGRLLRFMKKTCRGSHADIDQKYGQKPGTLWSVRASQKLRVFFAPRSGGGYVIHGFASRGDSVFRHE